MTTLISKPNGDYLLQAGLDSLHREATEWLSELEFLKTELSFLLKLLDKAFLQARGAQKLNELNSIEVRVKSLRNKSLKELHDRIVFHEVNLGQLDNNSAKRDEQSIREEHKHQESEVREFMDSVRKIKKEIFDIVEKQIKLTKKILSDFEKGRVTL